LEARNQSGSFLVEVPQLPKKEAPVSILWIVLIVVLVLALLGFVGRGF
jgi:flagellar basal body-associated protein FliL